jgi:serine/threonine protein kinase
MYPAEPDRCPSCFVPLLPGASCVDPICEADAADRSLNDLPIGATLDQQFRIGRVLGRGGFGITYLCWDERLQRRAAVKECFPQGLVRRSRDGVTVLAISENTRRQYEVVRDLFLREARVLAQFHDQTGIVSVNSILDTNGSAYLVMEYLSGQTLKEFLESQPDNRIEFGQALALLRPVMGALTAVHDQNWLHRDVAPDNIFVTRRGTVKLLDFGAARYAAGQQTKSLPVILKEGYAPVEQYATKGQQGSWTDVYALAATLYRSITGRTPPPALDRLEDDEFVAPSQLGVDIAPDAEAALISALSVRWQQRTRTIADFDAQIEPAPASEPAPEPYEPEPAPEPYEPAPAPEPYEPEPAPEPYEPPPTSNHYEPAPAPRYSELPPPLQLPPPLPAWTPPPAPPAPDHYEPAPAPRYSELPPPLPAWTPPPAPPAPAHYEPAPAPRYGELPPPKWIPHAAPPAAEPEEPAGPGERDEPAANRAEDQPWQEQEDLRSADTQTLHPEPRPPLLKALLAAALVIGLAIPAVYLLRPGASPVVVPEKPVVADGAATSTLVIDAVPWARVERVDDAAGKARTLPDSSTPLALTLPAGDYRVVLTGPPPGNERREMTVKVPPNATQIAPIVTFGEIRVEDYFRAQTKAAQ